MKKYLLSLLLFIFLFSLFACQTTTISTTSTKSTTTRDQSWKVVYDIVPTSPDFYEFVSTCYQIFPISYADSNGDGYGDLNGIRQSLEYLDEFLGVDCIWMTPIHKSPTYHKYDVVDYYSIDPQFGTMTDFENLMEEANDRGIRVLMDFVINHTAKSHPWFINSSNGPAASYRDYYVWNDLTDRQAFPNRQSWYLYNGSYYYASFWSEMPELNFDSQALRQELKTIASFWLEKGISGFRIDAAKHLYDPNEYPVGTRTLTENVHFFREFNAHIKSINPNAFLVGEVYVNNAAFVSNFYEGMDSAFNFELAEKLISSLSGNKDNGLSTAIQNAHTAFSQKRSEFIDSIFLTNHDQDRIFNKLGGNVDKLKLAAHITMTLPGIAWIYYGEELGMSGVKPDSMIRQPFKWGEVYSNRTTQSKAGGIGSWDSANMMLPGMSEQKNDETSLLRSYQAIAQFRKSNPILSRGNFQTIDNLDTRLFGYLLTQDNTTYFVLHHFGSQTLTVSLQANQPSLLYASHSVVLEGTSLTIAPYSTTIYQVNGSTVQIQS